MEGRVIDRKDHLFEWGGEDRFVCTEGLIGPGSY
jgi:hypothetical protein